MGGRDARAAQCRASRSHASDALPQSHTALRSSRPPSSIWPLVQEFGAAKPLLVTSVGAPVSTRTESGEFAITRKSVTAAADFVAEAVAALHADDKILGSVYFEFADTLSRVSRLRTPWEAVGGSLP